jgi:nucleoside-diphosphate-sugar epimerase
LSAQVTRVLIAGVTGWLGQQIAFCLLNAGKAEVRGLLRVVAADHQRAKRIDDLRDRGMTVARGDLADRMSLAKACEGIDVVNSAVECMLSWKVNAICWPLPRPPA